MNSQDYYNWTVGTSAGVFVALQTLAKLWPYIKAIYFRRRFPVSNLTKTFEIVHLENKGELYVLNKQKLRWISSSLTRSDLHFPWTSARSLKEKEWREYSIGHEIYTRGQRGK